MNRQHHSPAASTQVQREAGDWLVATRAMPQLSVEPAEEILRRTAALPGNARIVRTAEGVVVLAEVYLDDSDPAVAMAGDRLTRWLDGTHVDTQRPSEELVESLLAERGLAAERRDDAWTVRLEEVADLIVRGVDGGLRIEAMLAEFVEDNGSSDARPALAEFLCRAQIGLRFARAELTAYSALVAGWCDAATLAADLDRALCGVGWGHRWMTAEAQALGNSAVAQNYLDFVVNVVSYHEEVVI